MNERARVLQTVAWLIPMHRADKRTGQANHRISREIPFFSMKHRKEEKPSAEFREGSFAALYFRIERMVVAGDCEPNVLLPESVYGA